MIWIILLGYLIGMVLTLAFCLHEDEKAPFYASQADNAIISLFWPFSMFWVFLNILATLTLNLYNKIRKDKK